MAKLSDRDKRALVLGAVGVVVIVLYVYGSDWLDQWSAIRGSLAEKRAKMKLVDMKESKRAGLELLVPVFEMPKGEDEQKFLFRTKFNEQLKKAGIQVQGGLQLLRPTKSRSTPGYKILRLKFSKAKCNFGQIMDLLSSLNENPHLVGIDEFKMECKPDKRNEFELGMTVSTFIKSSD
jgi:hypothetical protein